MKKALLLSGGMDSTCIAFWCRPEVAITVDYGQVPARAERNASALVCKELGIEHCIISVDLRNLGSGDLAASPPAPEAPVSEWWPFRNQMLVTLASMKMIALGASELMIGALKTDCIHVDGTKDYLQRLSHLLTMQEGGITLSTPAIQLTASELVLASKVPEDILAWSHSCHKADLACGLCRGCQKHYQTFQALGLAAY